MNTKEMLGNGMHRKEEKLLGVDLAMDAMKSSWFMWPTIRNKICTENSFVIK